jgi:hypothetical protein
LIEAELNRLEVGKSTVADAPPLSTTRVPIRGTIFGGRGSWGDSKGLKSKSAVGEMLSRYRSKMPRASVTLPNHLNLHSIRAKPANNSSKMELGGSSNPLAT